MDDLADGNELGALRPRPWTIGHRLLSGRPQVRVLPGAPDTAGGTAKVLLSMGESAEGMAGTGAADDSTGDHGPPTMTLF
jgi:hypothetical protein